MREEIRAFPGAQRRGTWAPGFAGSTRLVFPVPRSPAELGFHRCKQLVLSVCVPIIASNMANLEPAQAGHRLPRMFGDRRGTFYLLQNRFAVVGTGVLVCHLRHNRVG